MESSIQKQKSVRVSAVQLEVAHLNPDTNRHRMVEFVSQEASKGGVDLIVFPELANTGYVNGRDKEFGKMYWECAEPVPGPTTEALGIAAKEYGVYVVVGMNQRHPTIPGTFYNSAVLIGRGGDIIGVQNKIHIPGQEKNFFVPGSSIYVYSTEIGW